MINLPSRVRRLFLIDLICALCGTVIYAVLFNFVTVTFHLPASLVGLQLAANFIYAVYGAWLRFAKPAAISAYRVLVGMNFAYAVFCLISGVAIFRTENFLGAALLISEGVLILLLAETERRAIR